MKKITFTKNETENYRNIVANAIEHYLDYNGFDWAEIALDHRFDGSENKYSKEFVHTIALDEFQGFDKLVEGVEYLYNTYDMDNNFEAYLELGTCLMARMTWWIEEKNKDMAKVIFEIEKKILDKRNNK